MTRIYIGLGLAALVIGAICVAWFEGIAHERDRELTERLQAAVPITARQRAGTVREVMQYAEAVRLVQEALPAVQRRIFDRCFGVLPDGAEVRAGGRGEAVSAPRAGDPSAAAAGTDEAARTWCRQLAEDYAAGARNTERLRLANGWIDANGGADP